MLYDTVSTSNIHLIANGDIWGVRDVHRIRQSVFCRRAHMRDGCRTDVLLPDIGGVEYSTLLRDLSEWSKGSNAVGRTTATSSRSGSGLSFMLARAALWRPSIFADLKSDTILRTSASAASATRVTYMSSKLGCAVEDVFGIYNSPLTHY